jgi:hypothetical protein
LWSLCSFSPYRESLVLSQHRIGASRSRKHLIDARQFREN